MPQTAPPRRSDFTTLASATSNGDFSGRWLANNPLNETRDFRMPSEGFNRVVVAGKFGLREQRMDLLVA